MIHKLKIQQKYLDRILSGEKTFEVRLNDRDYQVGDEIQFECLSSKSEELNRLGIVEDCLRSQDNHFMITYVHSGLGMINGSNCGADHDFVVLAIKQEKREVFEV